MQQGGHNAAARSFRPRKKIRAGGGAAEGACHVRLDHRLLRKPVATTKLEAVCRKR